MTIKDFTNFQCVLRLLPGTRQVDSLAPPKHDAAAAVRPDPFALHRQPSSSNFFLQLQICFAVGDFLEKFFTNAFSLLVNTI